MNDPICVDKKYSTTRLLIQADPVIFLPKAEGRKGEGGLRDYPNPKGLGHAGVPGSLV